MQFIIVYQEFLYRHSARTFNTFKIRWWIIFAKGFIMVVCMVLNLPLQRLQVRWHDNVKALYDDHKKECLSEVYLTIKIKWLWVLDYLTFCLTLFFQLISLAVLTYLETLGPRVYCITILYLEFFEGISQKG